MPPTFDLNRYAAKAAARLERPVFAGLPAVKAAGKDAVARGIGATLTDTGRADDAPIEVTGAPSVKLVPLPTGGVKIVITLRSRYADSMSFDALHEVAQDMVDGAKLQSNGPLRSKMLRALGHPFGRDKEGPRRTPKGLRYVRGIRGSVPDLTVINKQSGTLRDSWEYDIVRVPGGAAIEIVNSAPWAVFLASGTRRMQAHGPWTYLPITFRSRIMSAWQREIRRAQQAGAEPNVAAYLASKRRGNVAAGVAANRALVGSALRGTG